MGRGRRWSGYFCDGPSSRERTGARRLKWLRRPRTLPTFLPLALFLTLPSLPVRRRFALYCPPLIRVRTSPFPIMARACRTLATAAAAATLLVLAAHPTGGARARRCDFPSVYKGVRGVVSIEAEWQAPSVPAGRESPWSRSYRRVGSGRPTTRRPKANATFMVYKKDSRSGRTDRPPRSNAANPPVLTFPFTVDIAGYYRVLLRSAAEHPTEHNDAWVRLPDPHRDLYGFVRRRWSDDKTWRPLQLEGSRGYVKTYQNVGKNQPTFGTFTIDHKPSVMVTRWLTPGRKYKMQVAGRSTRWALDRVVLFKCARDDSESCVSDEGPAYLRAIGARTSWCRRSTRT